MMPKNIRAMNTREVKRVQQQLMDYYGAAFPEGYDWYLHERDNDVLLASPALEPPESLRAQSLGLYVAQLVQGGIRLSIEGAQLLAAADKHVIEITDPKAYLFGDDLPVEVLDGWHLVKSGSDMLGCSLVKDGILKNWTSKGRKIGSKE